MMQHIVDNYLEKIQDIKVIKDLIEKLSSYKNSIIYANDIFDLLSSMKHIIPEEQPDLNITSFNYKSGNVTYTIAIYSNFDIIIYANHLAAYIEDILAAISNFFSALIKEMKISDKELIDNFNRLFKDTVSRLLDLFMSNSYIEIVLDNRGKVSYIHTTSDLQIDLVEELRSIISNIIGMLGIAETFLIIKDNKLSMG